VLDGDTVEIEAKFLPVELKQVLKVRIIGVDTPEKAPRALCPQEAELAKKATEFTKAMVARGRVFQVNLEGWDKYGGRVLGDFFVDGQSIAQALIANGLARPYYGEKKSSWCN
jgi:endonuclease YncB( thermonuclease family)